MHAPPLTDLERRLGLVLGVLATVAFVALSRGNPLFLAVGLAMGVGLLLAAAGRNRVGAAFVSFVTTFGPWGFAAIAGAGFAAYAFWLLSRGARLNREAPPEPSAGTTTAPPAAGPVNGDSARSRAPGAPRPRSRRR